MSSKNGPSRIIHPGVVEVSTFDENAHRKNNNVIETNLMRL